MRRVFEISFEVCNKVGGIYTVVTSKAAQIQQYVDEYVLIGPHFSGRLYPDFVPQSVPDAYAQAFAQLEKQGIYCKYGKWLIKGEPTTVLIDFSGLYAQKNDLKKLYWDNFQVDSLSAQFDFDEPLVFASAAGKLIDAVCRYGDWQQYENVCQAHEWMTGFANLYVKAVGTPIKTVFTTHATILGRSICGSGKDLYQMLKNMDPYVEARNHGAYEKFSAERACALYSSVFTTVSSLTAAEAQVILGRKPDVLTLNGLDMDQFPSFEQSSVIHASAKQRLHEFYRYFFFPNHSFNLSKTLTFFVSGRYEFKNKGFDVTIRALAKLNDQMKRESLSIPEPDQKTVVCMFFVPYQTFGVKKELLENKIYFRHIEHFLAREQRSIHTKMMDAIFTKSQLNQQLFSIDAQRELRRLVTLLKRPTTQAPLCTHYLENEYENELIQTLIKNGLQNRQEDRVKAVFYPVYLNGADGLLDMSYYDATAGCHLGLFASYYEPWGYTPLEGAFMGVPVVTTTAAGFGQFMQPLAIKKEGIFVLDRLRRSDSDIVNEYAQTMYSFVQLNHHERVKHKIQAKLLSENADWKELVKNYVQAYGFSSDTTE